METPPLTPVASLPASPLPAAAPPTPEMSAEQKQAFDAAAEVRRAGMQQRFLDAIAAAGLQNDPEPQVQPEPEEVKHYQPPSVFDAQ